MKELLDHLLMRFGLPVVFFAVGIESLGIPAPGETAIVIAAIYAATTHRLSIQLILAAAIAGAIIGDNFGYLVGRRAGVALLARFGHRIGLDAARLRLARLLFHRYGARIVIIGRFVAVMRTWVAFLSGSNHMPWRRFLLANAIGGVVWASLVTVAAYELGALAERLSSIVGFGLLGLAIVAVVVAKRAIKDRLAKLQITADELYLNDA